MPAPQQVIPDCPPGLEYLLQIDRFIVSLRSKYALCTIDDSWSHTQSQTFIAVYYLCVQRFCTVVTSGWTGHYVYRVRNAEGQDIYSVEQSKIIGIVPKVYARSLCVLTFLTCAKLTCTNYCTLISILGIIRPGKLHL